MGQCELVYPLLLLVRISLLCCACSGVPGRLPICRGACNGITLVSPRPAWCLVSGHRLCLCVLGDFVCSVCLLMYL